jgi:hypothetical protein
MNSLELALSIVHLSYELWRPGAPAVSATRGWAYLRRQLRNTQSDAITRDDIQVLRYPLINDANAC